MVKQPREDRTQAEVEEYISRSTRREWSAIRDSERADNLDRLRAALPGLTAHTAGASWVGLRATTPDHLPLTGWRGENLGVLTGLGSKGYLYAPILASCLVAEAMGLPLPLERWVWEALHPVRHNPQET